LKGRGKQQLGGNQRKGSRQW